MIRPRHRLCIRTLLVVCLAIALMAVTSCTRPSTWEPWPFEEWQDELLSEPESAMLYLDKHLYYGMSEAELLSEMGPPTYSSTDLGAFRRFRIPVSGKVLTWEAEDIVLHAIIDSEYDQLVELLHGEPGTRRATSVLRSRATVFSDKLEAGADLTEIIRLLGSPDDVFLWPAGGWQPEMAGQLSLVYYNVGSWSSTFVFVDSETYKLLGEPAVVRPWEPRRRHWTWPARPCR